MCGVLLNSLQHFFGNGPVYEHNQGHLFSPPPELSLALPCAFPRSPALADSERGLATVQSVGGRARVPIYRRYLRGSGTVTGDAAKLMYSLLIHGESVHVVPMYHLPSDKLPPTEPRKTFEAGEAGRGL